MPIIAYSCGENHIIKRFVRDAANAAAPEACDACGKPMKKLLSAPTSTSKIVVDNGYQARAVEVNPDIVEINKARSEKDYREE